MFAVEPIGDGTDVGRGFEVVEPAAGEGSVTVVGAGHGAGHGGDGVGVVAAVDGHHDCFFGVFGVGQERPDGGGKRLEHEGTVVGAGEGLVRGQFEHVGQFGDAVSEANRVGAGVGAALNSTGVLEVSQDVDQFGQERSGVEGAGGGAGEAGHGVGLDDSGGDGETVGVGDYGVAGRFAA